MIITREVLNSKIEYYNNYNPHTKAFDLTTHSELVNLINGYKNLLIKSGVKPNQKILICQSSGIRNLAAFIASAELGLIYTVTQPIEDAGKYYAGSKIKQLLPIHHYLLAPDKNQYHTSKFGYYSLICDNIITKLPTDFSENLEIWATEDSIHHVCTSSGTSGTPKKIEHTHKFTYEISKRNTSYLGKRPWITFRPSHGSSMTTFYLPSIISENTERIYFYWDKTNRSGEGFNHVATASDCVQALYPQQAEQILDAAGKNPDLTVFTLAAIIPEWKEKYLESGKFKDIISLYGTSETSGPILVQHVSDKNFATDRFQSLDDYYPINIDNGTLETVIPVYDRYNNTQDLVQEHPDGGYRLIGRKDLIRINDLIIPTKDYLTKLEILFNNATLTYDTLYNKIYLSVWNDQPNIKECVSNLSEYLQQKSEGRHFISCYNVLNYEDFLSGIKLDHEMLREYYRNPDENYTKFN